MVEINEYENVDVVSDRSREWIGGLSIGVQQCCREDTNAGVCVLLSGGDDS